MENNLDRYFREKLHNREFEFKDAYWQGAEKLLDAGRRKRRRRWFAWWGGAMLLTAALAGWWFWGKNTGLAPGQQQAEPAANLSVGQEVGPSENAGTGKTLRSADVDEATTEGQKLAAGQTPAGDFSKEKAADSGLNLPEKNPDKPIFKNKNTSQSALEKNRSTSSLPPAGTGHENGHEGSLSSNAAENPVGGNAVNGDQSVQLAESEDFTIEREVTLLNLLETNIHFLDEVFPKSLRVNDAGNKPDGRFHFGLTASQLLLPRNADLIGYRAGLIVQVDLKNGWYLSSGVQYQRRSGTFESSKIAQSRNYRFGLELETQHLRPDALHYLNLPLLAGWQRGRHVMEGGLEISYLAGMTGKKGQFVKTGEPPRKEFRAEDKGWIVTDGYKRLTANAVLSYRYRVNRQWSFGLSGFYTPGGILDKNYDAPAEGYLLKERDKFYVGLQAVYLIN